MRIAIVLNTSWNIYNFRKGLIKSFIDQGHEVIAIAPKDNYSERLIEMGCEYYPVKMDSRGINPLKDLGLIYELFSLYRKSKPDVILHFTVKPNIYGTIAASLLGKPVINNVCGLGTAFIRRGIITRIVYSLYKISFRFSRKVFFQNWQDCKLFIRKNLVTSKKTEVIPGSGIDLAQFRPSNKQSEDGFTFLMISRIIRDKGVLEYVDAIRSFKARHPHIHFQLLGQKDPCHKHGIDPNLVDEWAESGLLEYLGTTDDVQSVIKEADCVVLPSYREGTPRTLLEAASMSKPVITTNTPGCNNVVTDNFNGFLCRVKDSEDLAEKLEQMYNLPEDQREKMGQNGRTKMENEFDENIIINRYLRAIEDIN